MTAEPSEAMRAYLQDIGPAPFEDGLEAEAAGTAYSANPEPADLTHATLAAAERLAQRTLAETTVTSVSVPVQLERVTFRLIWHRPRKWWQF